MNQSISLRKLLEQSPMEASAPCRIDMGGTLDLSTFHLPLRHFGPCTFNIALDLRTSVRLSAFERGKLKISSSGFESIVVDSANAPFNHPLGLMMAVASYFNADGIHVDIHSASPPRSALGGSSVAAVALIWAFAKTLANSGVCLPGPSEVAILAHAIEQSVAGVACGLQDQLAAVYGGVNGWYWTAETSGQPFRQEVVIPNESCQDWGRHILVAYCGVPHVSKDINGTWVRQFLSGRHRAVWHEITNCSRQFITALGAGNLELAQTVMNTETDLRRRMTPEVLDEMGDRLVAAAREHGCSARFTGAGGGGCIWALGLPEQMAVLKPIWETLLTQRGAAKILETGIDTTGVL